jgi:NAD(P)-dependent dehydrogenase (short-subunit alcohol dehydrogenase family)
MKGKVAVVLGASVRNSTGWAISERMASEGARVIVAARSLVTLTELAKKIGGTAIQCDATRPAEIEELFEKVRLEYGEIDVAISTVGKAAAASVEEADHDHIMETLAVNYVCNVHFVKHAARGMRSGGSIILFSSAAVLQPTGPNFAYSCAKAATDCLVRYAAIEFGSRGIRVNSIQPGPIRTAMIAQLLSAGGAEEVFAREIPLGRIGEPSDYADAVLWLAGSAFVTGANIPLSGGNQLTRMPRADELPLGNESWRL